MLPNDRSVGKEKCVGPDLVAVGRFLHPTLINEEAIELPLTDIEGRSFSLPTAVLRIEEPAPSTFESMKGAGYSHLLHGFSEAFGC
jgi:hypothetical protein